MTKFGFAALDDDHEHLFSLAAEVESRIARGGPTEDVRQKFHELVVSARTHFEREERYMEACRYPDLDPHRREHTEVDAWLAHLERGFATDGSIAAADAAEQTLAFLTAWLERHLTNFDRVAIRFMLARSTSETAPTP